MLTSGVESWNRWRTTEAGSLMVDLSGADLRGAQLNRAHLGTANLCGAILSGAELVMAYLRGTALCMADLRGAQMNGAYLSGADLRGAQLDKANLSMADLCEARLTEACMSGARLNGANLRAANLSRADLSEADLSHADVSKADLSRTDLRVGLGHTILCQIDLGAFCSASDVRHLSDSTIDWSSVAKSLRAVNLKDFLRRTGMPGVFIEYMVECARTLDPHQLFSLMQSTFISYGAPDEAFARHLNDALFSNGVTTFFFPKDAEPGQKLHTAMRDGVNKHDRIILVCSKASLDRRGVLNEIQETLAREARDGGASYLIPLALDDYVYSEWQPADPGVAQAVRDRVVVDFRSADPTKSDVVTRETAEFSFNVQLGRLLTALRKDCPRT